MTLIHALLSALVRKPCSGYDLAKQFDNSLEGSVGFFWDASHQQIYRELTRMESQGWLQAETIHQENRPNKKIYSVTATGRQALKDWICKPSDMSPIKDDLLVKLYAGYIVPREAIVQELSQHRDQHQHRLNLYRQIRQQYFSEPHELPDSAQFGYLTLLCGIRYEEGWLTWCDEVLAFLKSKLSRSQPSG